MVRKKVVVKNESGLHARPASILVRVASGFESEFSIKMYGYYVNGKSILGVMTLAAEFGSEMELIFEGPDEEKALEAVVDLFDTKFKEEN